MDKPKIYNRTKSYCPVCGKVLDTDIVEKNESMFMQKKCPEHGDFEIKIAKYAWYYKGLDSYRNNLQGQKVLENNQSPVYTAYINTECNLNCNICIAGGSYQKKAENISLDSFKKHLEYLKNKQVVIHISGGGEPTLREDLPDFIKLVTDYKNEAILFTNGVRISNDLSYLKKLKYSGLKGIYLWMETINNPEAYMKIRGKDFIELKKKVIKNMELLGIPLKIISVIAKGINETEIKDLLEYAKKKMIVDNIYFRGYDYIGIKKQDFSMDKEFLADELPEMVASQSNNLFTLEDIYYFQKLCFALAASGEVLPFCHQTTIFYTPRGKEGSLREIFRFDKIYKFLDKFENIWQHDHNKAKNLLSKYLSESSKHPDFHYLWEEMRVGIQKTMPYRHYCPIIMATMDNIAKCEVGRNQRECVNRAFNLGPDKNISRCDELLNMYK